MARKPLRKKQLYAFCGACIRYLPRRKSRSKHFLLLVIWRYNSNTSFRQFLSQNGAEVSDKQGFDVIKNGSMGKDQTHENTRLINYPAPADFSLPVDTSNNR